MAGRLILTTVGTSALIREKLELLYLRDMYVDLRRLDLSRLTAAQWREWSQGSSPSPRVNEFIEEYTRALLPLDIVGEVHKPPQATNVLSAELTSLHLMYEDKKLALDPDADSHALLLSDSPEGVLAGLIAQRCLSQGRFLNGRPASPQLIVIPGLQVENFTKFFPNGLKQFVQCIQQAGRREPTKERILNTTGGFKSLIPYATYLTLAWQIQMVFVFEELPHIINIHPAPINLSEGQKDQLTGMRHVIRAILTEQLGIDPIEL